MQNQENGDFFFVSKLSLFSAYADCRGVLTLEMLNRRYFFRATTKAKSRILLEILTS